MDTQQTSIEPSAIPETYPAPQKKPILCMSLSFVLFCTTVFFAYKYATVSKIANPSQVNTYADCVQAAGSIVQESYPATCVTKDAKRFVQTLTDEEKKNTEPPVLDTSSIPSNEIDNWNTYTNNVYKFSFKYPQDWIVTPSPVSEGQLNIIVDKKSNTSEQGFVPIQFSLGMATDINGKPLNFATLNKAKEYYSKQFDQKTVSILNTSIAKKSAISIIGTMAGPGPGEGNFIQVTLIDIGNQILTIQLGNKSYKEIFDQILSTLTYSAEGVSSSCVHNGTTYQSGQSFKDACNTCSCQSGQVTCTLMACRIN